MKNKEKYIIRKEDFIPVSDKVKHHELGEPFSAFNQFLHGFKKNKVAVICLILLILLIISSISASLSPYDPDALDLQNSFDSPNTKHLLGTDEFGRDSFTRALHGGRISLLIGFTTMFISTILGTLIGTISGYFGGILDMLFMRFVDVFLSVPSLLLIIVTYAFVAPTIFSLVMMLAFFSWPSVARIVRAETMSLVKRDFVVAAKSLGVSHGMIILKHIIPNLGSTIIVSATVSIARAILDESALSFLGYGVQLPKATWGSMLQEAQKYIMDAPLLAIVPGLLILLTVLCFNILGDALQTVFDPKLNH